jgi:hypothetical protein
MSDNAAFEKQLAVLLKTISTDASPADVTVRGSLAVAAIAGLTWQGGPVIGPGPHRFPVAMVKDLDRIYLTAFP